jgi:predicted alpha/beta superfamily hydrolase
VGGATGPPAGPRLRPVEILDFAGPGTLVRHRITPRGLAPRAVDVWLPPGAAGRLDDERPVVYGHDGQNLFLPQFAFAGVPWSLHTAALVAAEATGMPAPVLVGIWNAGDLRANEYLPPEPALHPTGTGLSQRDRALAVGRPSADRYLRLLAEEVLPLVESKHAVSRRRQDRFVLGSSMGGLVTLYCAVSRPDLFAAAGCVSTNFIIGGDPLVDWFAARLPEPAQVRLWFDRGTETLDGEYGPTQERMDEALRASPLVEGRDWVSRVYPGADHSEHAWAARAPEVLEFLVAGRS